MFSKEFYFVRHGQTDHNISSNNLKGDHPPDISLNATGRQQAETIISLIGQLPIATVCASPLKRVQETKAIISQRLQAVHVENEHLSECSSATWREMASRGMYADLPQEGHVREFLDRVKAGLEHVLTLPEPVLVVAHGGIHWALCSLLRIQDHSWAIDNCVPVHFKQKSHGSWRAELIVK